MRPGKDIANEFVAMAKMNRIMAGLNNKGHWNPESRRILLYLADRYPDAFESAVKHLKAMGKSWAQ